MDEPCAQRDLVRNRAAFPLLWILPVGIILATGQWAGRGWIMTLAWTASLLIMGGACLANARRCGRTHCYFTGPFFLIMATVSLTYGVHLLPLGPHGWSYIGAVLAGGGVLLCVLSEYLWGRYRRPEPQNGRE
jgi:hypothetical protein